MKKLRSMEKPGNSPGDIPPHAHAKATAAGRSLGKSLTPRREIAPPSPLAGIHTGRRPRRIRPQPPVGIPTSSASQPLIQLGEDLVHWNATHTARVVSGDPLSDFRVPRRVDLRGRR